MTALRPPEQVMRLARLGRFHQCRLSFLRQLTRRMQAEAWTVTRPVFEIAPDGTGHAVYTADTGARRYSLVAFAHDLPDHLRSDRVIAEAWDATFALHDGDPTPADIERLRANVPLQEAGRVSGRELTLSRTNRSARTWRHTVDALARGRQPDPAQLAEVGYLMRTTAVYGSGKFGAADRDVVADRPELSAPFQAEMLTVYLIRTFVRDLVNAMARHKGGAAAAALDPALARALGIGNSTGLGMAPFIVNHPRLFNNWIAARETALARVRARETATAAEIAMFRDLLARSMASAEAWQTESPLQAPGVAALRRDLAQLERQCRDLDARAHPWDALIRWSEDTLGTEAQECLVSLVLEPHGALVDDLTTAMADDTPRLPLAVAGTAAQLKSEIARHYDWALAIDWDAPDAQARAWYTSAEKLEPRLGERHAEPIAPYEQPLAPGRSVAALDRVLDDHAPDASVAEILRDHPEHRSTIRRIQLLADAPYAEIRDNTIAADLVPVDMLRCKLSFFGATHFDPRSDRWVRITMFQNAPYPEELANGDADTWVYPDRRPATAAADAAG